MSAPDSIEVFVKGFKQSELTLIAPSGRIAKDGGGCEGHKPEDFGRSAKLQRPAQHKSVEPREATTVRLRREISRTLSRTALSRTLNAPRIATPDSAVKLAQLVREVVER